MEYRNIGKSDLEASVVGFGGWQAGRQGWGTEFDDRDCIDAMKYAFNNGVNYIDTAEMYGHGHSEEVIREAISGMDREKLVIATKVNPPHFKHDEILRSCENSIRRMNCKYIDLYQLHWPDHSVPISETLGAMEELVDSGKVRYIGVSNYNREELEEAMASMKKHEIVSNQMRYNIIQRGVERDLYPSMKVHGISMIAWSPIAKGLLSGKYGHENIPTDQVRKNDPLFSRERLKSFEPLISTLKTIAEKRDKTIVQVSLNYLLKKGAFVIPGIKRVDQIKDCMGSSGWSVTDAEVSEIERLAPGTESPGD